MPNAMAIMGNSNSKYAEVDSNGNLKVTLGTGLSSTTDSVNVKDVGTPIQTAVSVGVTDTSVLAANANRKFLALVNNSANDIYVNFGASAALNLGILLNARGGSVCFDKYVPTSTVNAISAVASQSLLVMEG